MKVFLYSPIRAQVIKNNASFIIGKNLVLKDLFKDEVLSIDLGERFLPAKFSFDKDFNKNVAITDLYGDFLVYPALKPRLNFPYETTLYKSVVIENAEYIFTVYKDFGIKLKCKNSYEEVIVNLPFIPDSLNVLNAGGNLILVELKGKLTYIVVLSFPSLKLEFCDLADEYSLGGELSLTKIHRGISLHKITYAYGYDGKVFLKNKSYQTFDNYSPLPSPLIPLAFLEEVRLGVDYRRFLGDNLLAEQEDYRRFLDGNLLAEQELLKEFFGDFLFVLPPFYEDLPDTYAIVYKNRVKYAKFTVSESKITDISLEDSF